MKNAVLGAVASLAVIIGVAGWLTVDQPVYGRTSTPQPGLGSGLIVVDAQATGGHRLIVVDPDTRALGVYQIDDESGRVELRSVRNIQWDLQMPEFNGAAPLPREIRELLEQK